MRVKKNILIVEDEILIAQQIQKYLIQHGYAVVGISVDYSGTFDYLESNQVDMVLLDININGSKDGIDVANQINKQYRIPFFFLTSYNDKKTINRLKETNPVGYISKPVNEMMLTTNLDIFFNEENQRSQQIISLKSGKTIHNINISELRYVESEHVYLNFYFLEHSQTIRATLVYFLELVSKLNTFVQINRSTAVNVDFIQEISLNEIKIDHKNFKISEKYKANIKY